MHIEKTLNRNLRPELASGTGQTWYHVMGEEGYNNGIEYLGTCGVLTSNTVTVRAKPFAKASSEAGQILPLPNHVLEAGLCNCHGYV